MAEDLEQEYNVQASQESEILSQETFSLLWKSISETALSSLASSINLADLDSSNIDSSTSHQPLLSIEETDVQEGLHANDNIVIPPVVELPTQISSTVGSNVSSSLPACETWPGIFNFTVSFSPQHKSTKGVAWTYSPIKDKLYVGKDAPCPINFSVNTTLPDNFYIRVMALYTSPEQVSEIVHRCVNHSMEEIKSGRIEAEHLIRCESATATYHTDASRRHSVLVPFENPPAGQKYSTYIYKFACFGSCSGGPNRRPLMLIFTLESGGQVIGRRKLDVKICACPGRDRKSEEAQCTPVETCDEPVISSNKRKISSECVAVSEILEFTKSIYAPLPKKKKTLPNKDGNYNLSTNDKECYDFLYQMKKFFEMCKAFKNIPPEVLQTIALQNLQKIKNERKD